MILEFRNAPNALQAASALQEEFHEGAHQLDLPGTGLRTGIHYGEVARAKDGDIFGDAVNIASRLEGIAEPDQTVLSQAIIDKLDPELRFEDLGEMNLKNVSEPVRCYAVRQ